MTTKKDALLKEISELKRRIENLSAQDISAYTKAREEIEKLSKKCLIGSGVIISIRHLSGEVALSPVMITDGLGAATLECLATDILSSHSLRISCNPARRAKVTL